MNRVSTTMKYNRERHHRRSIRLSGYDYSQSGGYFVTICAEKRACLFGTVTDGTVRLNDTGQIVQSKWLALADRFPHITLDSFVVMPNHIHGVIFVGAQFIAPSSSLRHMDEAAGAMNRAPTLGEVVRTYKAICARAIRCSGYVNFKWQRNYYEHVIRSENSLNCIRRYIVDNPVRWDCDRENPAAITPEPKDSWLA